MIKPMKYGHLSKLILVFCCIGLSLNGCGNQNSLIEPEPVIHGTVAFWHFDETSGSTAIDSSGNGFDGTIYGAPRFTGKVGQALQFGSSGSRVEVPALENVFQFQEITLDAWLNPTTLTPGAIYQIIGDGAGGLQFFKFQLNNGKCELLLSDGWNYQSIITSNASLATNTWFYVAITFDGGVARLYINGVEDNSSAIPFPIGIVYNRLYIGALESSNLFPGIIDELRISNVIFSPAEILVYYQQTNI